MTNGKYAEAIGWGVEVAQHVEQVTGIATMFLTNDYGPFARVTWIGVAADAAAADDATRKINTDPSYLDQLNKAATLFLPGTGHRTLLARLA